MDLFHWETFRNDSESEKDLCAECLCDLFDLSGAKTATNVDFIRSREVLSDEKMTVGSQRENIVKKRGTTSKFNVSDIEKMYLEDGMSVQEIATNMACSYQTMNLYLKKMGLWERKKLINTKCGEVLEKKNKSVPKAEVVLDTDVPENVINTSSLAKYPAAKVKKKKRVERNYKNCIVCKYSSSSGYCDYESITGKTNTDEEGYCSKRVLKLGGIASDKEGG